MTEFRIDLVLEFDDRTINEHGSALVRNLHKCHFVHDKPYLILDRTRVAAAGSGRLTAWAMAPPKVVLILVFKHQELKEDALTSFRQTRMVSYTPRPLYSQYPLE